MKKILLSLLICTISITTYSQSKLWTKVSEDKIRLLDKFERANMPFQYELFSVNFPAMKALLSKAPLDSDGIASNLQIDFPDYNGKLSKYVIYEAPIMEKGLSNKFPDIKSYIGVGVEDKTAVIRFSTTLFGLHVMMISGEAGTYYIDTYTKDLNNYIVYNRNNISNSRSFSCLVEDDAEEIVATENLRATDGKFRQYRLAMACTIEYAAYHVNAAGLNLGTETQKKAAVLAAMNVTMTRVNGIYEKDMSLRMNLVANNDLIIFITSDNFSNDNANALINESQIEIDNVIGISNYDIGHTVSTGGGGLATLNSPCTSGKARGITGSPAPVGDPYDVDYVAHEMGHQFGGPHTFNGAGGACTGNRSSADAVEPGSGSTIMAYAGICSGVNVQSNSDSYFHAVSIAKMTTFMTGTGNCAANASNNNTPPTITPLVNYTIPYGTAFVLKGNGNDIDNTASLTYCWEQTNPGTSTNSATTTSTNSPNFRSVNPTSSPDRYFPKFSDVMAGNLAPTWEVIPNVARTMNFALTVRDNQTPTGGQTARANMILNVANVGPFAVTSPNVENTSWTQGTTQTITWSFAGTTGNGINTSNVNILLSTDNGVTFSTLVANTLNDGSENITVPNIAAPYCRIKIEPVGNIYYALSKNISIGYTVVTQTTCTDYTRTFSPPVAMATGWTAYNIPAVGENYTISDANLTIVSTAAATNQVSFGLVKPGSGVVDYVAFDGPTSGCTFSSSNLNVIFDDEGATFNCANTNSGLAYKPVSSFTTLDGLSSLGTWRLAAKSTSTSNTISSAKLTLCRTETTVTLANESFGLQDFSIFPNPNTGSFNVKFVSNSSNKVKIGVYDLRGRSIFENDFQNTGTFNQNIQLNSIQTGIYLVTVQDGEKKEVKKIIIE